MSKKGNSRTSTPKSGACIVSGAAIETVEEKKATVSITVPIAPLEEGAYVGDHVDVHLDHCQRVTMRRMLNGLKDGGARLANERVVQNYGDVVRYILDQVYVDMDQE